MKMNIGICFYFVSDSKWKNANFKF